MNSAIIFEKDPRTCVNRPGAWPNLDERSDKCIVVRRRQGSVMPSHDQTPAVIHLSVLGTKGHAICGKWTTLLTGDSAQVTCRSCLNRIAARSCENPECRKEFAPASWRQRFCTKACQEASYLQGCLGRGSGKLAPATRGAVSEMVAACDLMERGYEVFRALSAACSCDLIALGPDRVPLRIEVRTGRLNTATGRLSFNRNTGGHRHRTENDLEHYAVVIGANVIYEPPLPGGAPDAAGPDILAIISGGRVQDRSAEEVAS